MPISTKVLLCPWCQSPQVRRSQRWNFMEQAIFRLLWIKPYRCEACNRRFYRFLNLFNRRALG